MSAADRTTDYLHDNLPRIERAIEDYKKDTARHAALVLLVAESSRIAVMDMDGIEQLRATHPTFKNHQAIAEVKHRHAAGAYLDENGEPWDVPIICEAETVFRTSLQTFKLRLEFEAAGAEIRQSGSMINQFTQTASPKRRFKKRRRK